MAIAPGTICVLLEGPSRGKRVVALKQLKSSMILVSGPKKINGVSLKRVNSTQLLVTSTTIDVSKLNVDKFDDAYFNAIRDEYKAQYKGYKKSMKDFFAEKKTARRSIADSDQNSVDDALCTVIAKDPMMQKYMASKFQVRCGFLPHELNY
eukprot:GHVH01004285.1.p1 GENE.GHVH01004285.1~~GHVH01004285.1.p1  ORF type:complete len:151 (+),score=28.02 GHVH01004285.1:92-544(+)